MNNRKLNVVYIGPQPFPIGGATTKRRRYMVDYMNAHNIQSHYLVCDFKQRGKRQNAIKGMYGKCDYYDITPLAENKNYFRFWKEGKKTLNEWFVPEEQNVLIFATVLSVFEYPFYLHAKKIGYKIVFDQVETSLMQNGKIDFLHSINIRISEFFSDKAYRHSSAFVISNNLMNEVHKKYPNRKLCLLPNSTPRLNNQSRDTLNNPLKVLYSGTYSPKDGVEYLLKGVIEAYEHGIAVELILLGKGSKEDMKVLELAKGKDYIHYLGYVSDEELNSHLLACDVLCMTRCNSRFANYGFPFKLSEYLATGNIVLATNIGDVELYVKDKESAYIIPSENSHAIATTLQHIVEYPQEALSVANGGLKVMQQYFSIESVGVIFINFLKEV